MARYDHKSKNCHAIVIRICIENLVQSESQNSAKTKISSFQIFIYPQLFSSQARLGDTQVELPTNTAIRALSYPARMHFTFIKICSAFTPRTPERF